MAQLKICTDDLEWMTSFFGARKDADWRANPEIPASFPGKTSVSSGIRLRPIADVQGLCRRIASGIEAIDPDVLFIEEGPPLQEQMELFVSTFPSDEYVSYRSNRTDHAIHALVRRSFASDIKPWLPDSSTPQMLWRHAPFYPWGAIAGTDRKSHSLASVPAAASCKARFGSGPDAGRRAYRMAMN